MKIQGDENASHLGRRIWLCLCLQRNWLYQEGVMKLLWSCCLSPLTTRNGVCDAFSSVVPTLMMSGYWNTNDIEWDRLFWFWCLNHSCFTIYCICLSIWQLSSYVSHSTIYNSLQNAISITMVSLTPSNMKKMVKQFILFLLP